MLPRVLEEASLWQGFYSKSTSFENRDTEIYRTTAIEVSFLWMTLSWFPTLLGDVTKETPVGGPGMGVPPEAASLFLGAVSQ